MTTKQLARRRHSRRFTLDASQFGTDSGTLTLEDLRTFIEDHEEYNPRLRAVTFEVDDAVTDPS